MGKTLTPEQARNLLITQPRRPENAPVWPKKIDRELLFEAAQRKHKKVTFSNGKVFNILYSKHDSIAWGMHDVIYIHPADETFVPCGWFHIKFILVEGE
jgi:hypothetical protein